MFLQRVQKSRAAGIVRVLVQKRYFVYRLYLTVELLGQPFLVFEVNLRVSQLLL